MLMLMVSPLKLADVCATAGWDTTSAAAASSSVLIISIRHDRRAPDRRRGLVGHSTRSRGTGEGAARPVSVSAAAPLPHRRDGAVTCLRDVCIELTSTVVLSGETLHETPSPSIALSRVDCAHDRDLVGRRGPGRRNQAHEFGWNEGRVD